MIKKLLIVVVVLAALVVFLLVRDYDSPELGQALLDKAGEATGIEMSATGFRLNLLRGVVMEGVEASSVTEAREFQFSLDRLVFEHRLLPLLSGTVVIDRIVLERPQFELVEAEVEQEQASSEPTSEPESGEEAPAGETVADEGGFALDIQQVVVSDGTVVLRKKGEDGGTQIEGLDFEMNDLTIDPTKESLAAIRAEGELGVVRILADTIEIREAASQFRLADAKFEMPELSFVTDHGRFQADMQVDFNPVPFTYSMSARGDPLDVNGIVGASEGFGPGLVQLEASGEGAETKDVDADGGLQLGEGQFPDVAMFSGIDKALGKQVVVGSSYRAAEAKFHLANNVVTLAPFRFETDSLRLDLEGTLSLEGPLQFQLVAATPREGLTIEGVGGTALDVLADDEGWVPVPIQVSGTMEDPKVRPDAKALMAQAGQGAKREAKKAATEAATDALKGLLGGRKKP